MIIYALFESNSRLKGKDSCVASPLLLSVSLPLSTRASQASVSDREQEREREEEKNSNKTELAKAVDRWEEVRIYRYSKKFNDRLRDTAL